MERESNYELLRVISAVAVIVLHVSALYITAATTKESALNGKEHMITNCMYNALSRFAVPCFIMLSGAFALDKEKNLEFKYYYAKIFQSMGMPVIVVSILYVIYSVLIAVMGIVVKGKGIVRLLQPIQSVITGAPFSHLWYVSMMFWIFIATPVIIRLKKEFGEKLFDKIAVVFLPLAMVSLWTSTHKLNWDLGFSFCYMGYYMIGDVIRRKFGAHKNNYHGCLMIAAGVLVLTGMAYLRYLQLSVSIPDSRLEYQLVAPYSPLAVIASLLIFTGFTMLALKLCEGGGVKRLAGITFEIYLFHAGICIWLKHIVSVEMDSRIVIPVAVILILALSVAVSLLYRKLWKIIESKTDITDKALGWLRLK